MADSQTPQITKQDVQSLAEKLKELKPSLTTGEQRALRAMAARAAIGRDQDVKGFLGDSVPDYYQEAWGEESDPNFAQTMPSVIDFYASSLTDKAWGWSGDGAPSE